MKEIVNKAHRDEIAAHVKAILRRDASELDIEAARLRLEMVYIRGYQAGMAEEHESARAILREALSESTDGGPK